MPGSSGRYACVAIVPRPRKARSETTRFLLRASTGARCGAHARDAKNHPVDTVRLESSAVARQPLAVEPAADVVYRKKDGTSAGGGGSAGLRSRLLASRALVPPCCWVRPTRTPARGGS
eukprot:gene15131-biopygen7905